MLARLEELDGVRHAETDFSADHLRLSVDDARHVPPARELLTSLGYGTETLKRRPSVKRWYNARSVGALSRMEAGVIAGRVVRIVETRVDLNADTTRRLRDVIARELHRSFAETQLGVGSSGDAFRAECVRRTVATLIPDFGSIISVEVGRALDADMRATHRS